MAPVPPVEVLFRPRAKYWRASQVEFAGASENAGKPSKFHENWHFQGVQLILRNTQMASIEHFPKQHFRLALPSRQTVINYET